MRLLVISDTHGYAERLEQLVGKIGKIDALIHCGDVEGQTDYIEKTAGCPCYFVAGNNDWSAYIPQELFLEMEGHKIMVTHGHTYGISMTREYLRREAESRGIDIVFFGHTHKPVIDTDGPIAMLNPGSLSYPRQQGRQPTYMIVEMNGSNVHYTIGQLPR